ncbi:unnamed protein product [Cyclocybe aegerita]|uniref:SGNH hydrolase-type esterase domain-containing protein n=1 Tax=Cyclocybe aegerita TaxID=1973307 RepID=A0A8S0VZK6_CYCAE|nr:unnamed protein product [Cyclocybe aegerita]
MRPLESSDFLVLSEQSGRWVTTESGSVIASWTSASISFLFTGSKLGFRVGPQTERKDKANGGTRMVTIITGNSRESALQDTASWRALDPQPSCDVVIFDTCARHDRTFVQIVLIDWASQLEIQYFYADDEAKFEGLPEEANQIPRILLVGDSISSAMAVSIEQGGELVPFGILDGFPFVAQRRLLQRDPPLQVAVDLVAYPGLNLVRPTEEEKEKGHPLGMVDAFFWKSPWTKEAWVASISPIVVMIELGTNDQFFQVPKEKFGDAFIELIQKLLSQSQNSFMHVWLVPPFPDEDTDSHQLNEAMPYIIDRLQNRFGPSIEFKICDLVEGLTAKDTVDGVHPSLKAHQRLGEQLAAFIERNLFESTK